MRVECFAEITTSEGVNMEWWQCCYNARLHMNISNMMEYLSPSNQAQMRKYCLAQRNIIESEVGDNIMCDYSSHLT